MQDICLTGLSIQNDFRKSRQNIFNFLQVNKHKYLTFVLLPVRIFVYFFHKRMFINWAIF